MKKITIIILISTFLFSQINIKNLVDRIDLDGTSRKYIMNQEKPYTGQVFLIMRMVNLNLKGF